MAKAGQVGVAKVTIGLCRPWDEENIRPGPTIVEPGFLLDVQQTKGKSERGHRSLCEKEFGSRISIGNVPAYTGLPPARQYTPTASGSVLLT